MAGRSRFSRKQRCAELLCGWWLPGPRCGEERHVQRRCAAPDARGPDRRRRTPRSTLRGSVWRRAVCEFLLGAQCDGGAPIVTRAAGERSSHSDACAQKTCTITNSKHTHRTAQLRTAHTHSPHALRTEHARKQPHRSGPTPNLVALANLAGASAQDIVEHYVRRESLRHRQRGRRPAPGSCFVPFPLSSQRSAPA